MKIYNSPYRQIEEFIPLRPPLVTVYTCGPTVYDKAHIGHWFNYVRMDMLIRTLIINGFEPKWVMNITDVGHLVSDADEGEDKLEKGARREGKSAWDIASKYTADFLEGMQQMNITTPSLIVKATEHINDQIDLIKLLENKGYTYVIDDGVYFDTSKFPEYGDFAQLDLDEQKTGARVSFNPQKRQPQDFALWKFSPKDRRRDMEWDSPWGKGFPGWHIECSAMSMKYLGETLDMHTGGIDHIAVHHTNEIAQSEAATGKRFANYWMHSNHVLIDGQKISKSLNNSITLADIEKRGYSADVLRLHILESHYRSQSRFSFESLNAAQNRLNDYRSMAALRYQARKVTNDAGTFALEDVPKELAGILANDLDTPSALAFLSQVSTQLQTVHIEEDMLDHFVKMLQGIDNALGLRLMEVKDITDEQKDLIHQRESARAAKNWQLSDEIRGHLQRQGIALKDAQHGPIWSLL
ncbi:MAG TPA: cysteine--tRNA ligase [Candidatus Saccharimonadales bacterium]|nr:cysteine--tRNA ligase [Candidatus Saccharimonadales bacterium]